MRVILSALLVFWAASAVAFELNVLEGSWRGAGLVEREGKSAEEVRCRLQAVEVEGLTLRLSGRCATEAGSREIALDLIDLGSGEVMAWDGTAREGSARDVLMGRKDEDGLTLKDGTAEVVLRLEDGGFVLQTSGEYAEGPARSEIRFQR